MGSIDGHCRWAMHKLHTFWEAHLRELGSAVRAMFLSAVAIALCGQEVTAVPASQGHEPFMLKHLLLCHIDTTAAAILQQCNNCQICLQDASQNDGVTCQYKFKALVAVQSPHGLCS